VNHPFYSIGPKIMFGYVSEHFTNLRQVKRCKTCVSRLNAMFQSISLTFDTKKMQNLRPSLNAQFWDTKVVKHPFDSIGPEMIFGSISEHFDNIRQVKDAKLVFRD
jgi:hypothetical protein